MNYGCFRVELRSSGTLGLNYKKENGMTRIANLSKRSSSPSRLGINLLFRPSLGHFNKQYMGIEGSSNFCSIGTVISPPKFVKTQEISVQTTYNSIQSKIVSNQHEVGTEQTHGKHALRLFNVHTKNGKLKFKEGRRLTAFAWRSLQAMVMVEGRCEWSGGCSCHGSRAGAGRQWWVATWNRGATVREKGRAGRGDASGS